MPRSEPLLVGALGDAMAMSVGFSARISTAKGLPSRPDNLAEGIVIKPLTAPQVSAIDTDRKSVV